MKKLALGMCLLTIGGLATMGTNACSSSSSAGASSGGAEAGEDTSSSSSGSSSGSSSSGSSSGTPTDSGGDGPTCTCCSADGGGLPVSAGPAACDSCLAANCGDSACPCIADSSVDDAGNPGGCLGYVDCIGACTLGNPEAGVDAGSLSQCVQECSPAYSMQQIMEGNAFIACFGNTCGASCLQ